MAGQATIRSTADDGNASTLEGDTLQLGTLADLSTLVTVSNGLNADGNETFSEGDSVDGGTGDDTF